MRRALEPADDYQSSIAVNEYAEAQAEADAETAARMAEEQAAEDICDRDVIEDLTNYCGLDTHAAVARCMRNFDVAIMEIAELTNYACGFSTPALDALTTALSHLQRDLRAARYDQIKAGCLAQVRGE